MSNALKITLRVATVVVTCLLLGWGCYLFGITIIQWWCPMLAALILAAAVWIPAREWRCNATDRPWRFCVHMAVLSVVFCWALLALNYYPASDSSLRTESAVVERKFTRERHRSRRVGRRYTYSGEKYNVYYLELRMPDGRLKEKQLTPKEYARVRTGSIMPVEVKSGLLGFDVITDW